MYDQQPPSEQELTPELAALERQLRGMKPTAPRVDRDRLMYAAGQAAAATSAVPGRDGRAIYDPHIADPSWVGRPWASPRFWQATTCLMTAATLLLATMLVWQRHSQSAVEPTIAQTMMAPNANTTLPDPALGETYPITTWNTSFPIPSANSGYLAARYVALTRGLDALSPALQSDQADPASPPRSRTQPLTPRGTLDDFLPNSSRS